MLKKNLLNLAKYNIWSTNLITTQLQPLKKVEIEADKNLYFMSIIGTINHLVLSEELWWCRNNNLDIKESEFSKNGKVNITTFWSKKGAEKKDWATVIDPSQSIQAWNRVVSRWPSLIENLSEEELGKPFRYKDTSGSEFELNRA